MMNFFFVGFKNDMIKYIFVIGGVVLFLGKGFMVVSFGNFFIVCGLWVVM